MRKVFAINYVTHDGVMQSPGQRSNDPTITAFERSPDRGKGLARDMARSLALEEVGQPYDVRLLSFSEMKESAHRMLSSFRADSDL